MTATQPSRRNRRPSKRELFFSAHPDQLIQGNGKKYFLHLLQPEQLQKRGISAKKTRLIINAYPIPVLQQQVDAVTLSESRWHVMKDDALHGVVLYASL